MLTRESSIIRTGETFLSLLRLISRRDEDAVLGAALALGRLCRRTHPGRLEVVLGLVRKSYEAAG
jgi:hypothetical protein